MPCTARPFGVTLLSLFCVFGTLMASLTAVMLLFPGTILDLLWRLNPRAHEGFAMLGWWAVLLMGDTMNAVIGHDWHTLIGLPIGGAMIAYLVSRRRVFVKQNLLR